MDATTPAAGDDLGGGRVAEDIHGAWPRGWTLIEGPFDPPAPLPYDAIPVPVYGVAPGVWLRAAGTDAAGQPLTVSGPVVAGPDDHGDVRALLVRDYTARRDVVVFVPAGDTVDLVEPDPVHVEEWAAAPTLPAGASWVRFMRFDAKPSRNRWKRDHWTVLEGPGASLAELAELDADPDVIIMWVDWAATPIGM